MITLLFIYFVLNLPLPTANFCLGALQAAGLFVVEFNEVTQKQAAFSPTRRQNPLQPQLPAFPTSLTLPSSGYQPPLPRPTQLTTNEENAPHLLFLRALR